MSISSTSLSSDTTTLESESRSLPVVTYVSITAVFIAILIVIMMIVMIALIRKKVSQRSAQEVIYDEIHDTATTRNQQLQFTSDILTDGNPAYGTPASHLPTSSKEMEMTQNYAYVPTNFPVEPNECYSSVNPDQLNATWEGTSQLAATGEYDYVIP